ncbi:ATP-binding protein [Actinoplanes sp. M2I2]|uniref:ATP-binding protein n=1 Tax=Actinoplanes sp. M2I2 TaxID=1734444 RepID=UPI002021819D|nr:ATP-binding protein [Actinoplanes sp. M2I2]
MTMPSVREHGSDLAHTAIVGSAADLPAVLVPELRRSAGRYDEVLLVVGHDTRAALQGQVGELDGNVRWSDPRGFYQRLGFAYESFRRYLAGQAEAGRRVHVIAEPDLTGGADPGLRASAYLSYEAMCNETYAPYGCAVTCVWGEQHHSPAVLEGARATHPHLLTATGPVRSGSYQDAERYLAGRRDPWPPAPAEVDEEVILAGVADLRRLRSVVHTWAADRDFADEPIDDVVVAVVEVAANGLRHGAAPVRVRAWHDQDTLVVQCDDSAGRPLPVTAGYRRPGRADAAPDGRGLWLARQLADVVIIGREPGRTSVRLHFPHEIMHRGAA